LVNNNRRLAEKLEPFIKKLKKKLLKQPVLHADETGYYYQGQRNWLHTLCTEKHTFWSNGHLLGCFKDFFLPFIQSKLK